ncbi:hypothetical protein B0H13DRAFT_2020003 [Mycena leptocephala]|nr:hypothetical protein B0H13DRAFT_2020003 [Mycena leptocephala]
MGVWSRRTVVILRRTRGRERREWAKVRSRRPHKMVLLLPALSTEPLTPSRSVPSRRRASAPPYSSFISAANSSSQSAWNGQDRRAADMEEEGGTYDADCDPTAACLWSACMQVLRLEMLWHERVLHLSHLRRRVRLREKDTSDVRDGMGGQMRYPEGRATRDVRRLWWRRRTAPQVSRRIHLRLQGHN